MPYHQFENQSILEITGRFFFTSKYFNLLLIVFKEYKFKTTTVIRSLFIDSCIDVSRHFSVPIRAKFYRQYVTRHQS